MADGFFTPPAAHAGNHPLEDGGTGPSITVHSVRTQPTLPDGGYGARTTGAVFYIAPVDADVDGDLKAQGFPGRPASDLLGEAVYTTFDESYDIVAGGVYKIQLHYRMTDNSYRRTQSVVVVAAEAAPPESQTLPQDDSLVTIGGTVNPLSYSKPDMWGWGYHSVNTVHGDELDNVYMIMAVGDYTATGDLRSVPGAVTRKATYLAAALGANSDPVNPFFFPFEDITYGQTYTLQALGKREVVGEEWEVLGLAVPYTPRESDTSAADGFLTTPVAAPLVDETDTAQFQAVAFEVRTNEIPGTQRVHSNRTYMWFAETSETDNDTYEDVSLMAGALSVKVDRVPVGAGTPIYQQLWQGTARAADGVGYNKYYKVQYHYKLQDDVTEKFTQASFVRTPVSAGATQEKDDILETMDFEVNAERDKIRFSLLHHPATFHGDELHRFKMYHRAGDFRHVADMGTLGNGSQNTTPRADVPGLHITDEFTFDPTTGHSYQAFAFSTTPEYWQKLGEVRYVPPAEGNVDASIVAHVLMQFPPFENPSTLARDRVSLYGADLPAAGNGRAITDVTGWFIETTPDDTDLTEDISQLPGAQFGAGYRSNESWAANCPTYVQGAYYKAQFHYVLSGGDTVISNTLVLQTVDYSAPTVAQDDRMVTIDALHNINTGKYNFRVHHEPASFHGDEFDSFYVVYVEGAGASQDLRVVPNNVIAPCPDVGGQTGFKVTAALDLKPLTQYRFQALGKREADQQWETLGQVMTFVTQPYTASENLTDPHGAQYSLVSGADVTWRVFARSMVTAATGGGATIESAVAYFLETTAGDEDTASDISQAAGVISKPAEDAILGQDARAMTGSLLSEEFNRDSVYKAQFHFTRSDNSTGRTQSTLINTFDENGPSVAQDDEAVNLTANEQGDWVYFRAYHAKNTIHGDELESLYAVYVEGNHTQETDLRNVAGHVIDPIIMYPEIAEGYGHSNGAVLPPDTQYTYQIFGERTTDQPWETYSELRTITTLPAADPDYQVVQSPPFLDQGRPDGSVPNRIRVESYLGAQVAHNVVSGIAYLLETTAGDAEVTADISGEQGVLSVPVFVGTGATPILSGSFQDTAEPSKTYKGQIHYTYSDGATGRTDSGFITARPDANDPTVAQDDTVTTGSAIVYKSDEPNRYLFNGVHNQGSIHGDELESLWLVYVPDSDYDAGADLRTSPNSITKAMGQSQDTDAWATNALLEFDETYRYQVFGKRVTDQPWEAFGEILTVTVPAEQEQPSSVQDENIPALFAHEGNVSNAEPTGDKTINVSGNLTPSANGGSTIDSVTLYATEGANNSGEDLREVAGVKSWICSKTTIADTPSEAWWYPGGLRHTEGDYTRGATVNLQMHWLDSLGREGATQVAVVQSIDPAAPTVAQDDTFTTGSAHQWTQDNIENAGLRVSAFRNDGTIHGDELDTFQMALVEGVHVGVPDLRDLPGVQVVNTGAITADTYPLQVGSFEGLKYDTDYSFQAIGSRMADQPWEYLSHVGVGRTAPELSTEVQKQETIGPPTLWRPNFGEGSTLESVYFQTPRTPAAEGGREIEILNAYYVEITDPNDTLRIQRPELEDDAVLVPAAKAFGTPTGELAMYQAIESGENLNQGSEYSVRFVGFYDDGVQIGTQPVLFVVPTDGVTAAQDDTVTTVPYTPNSAEGGFFLTQHNAGTIHGDELEEFSMIFCEGARGTGAASPDLRTVEGHVVVRQAQAQSPAGEIDGLWYATDHAYPFVEGETYSFQSLGKRTSDQQWETLGRVLHYVHPVTNPIDHFENAVVILATPASEVDEDSAQLNGAFNNIHQSRTWRVTYFFRYGKSYDPVTNEIIGPTDSDPVVVDLPPGELVEVSTVIPDVLDSGTPYIFRLVVESYEIV